MARSGKRALGSNGERSPVVAVASYGRAGRVSTVDVFPSGVIVVPEKQGDSYRALQELPAGWEVVTIPDGEDGNLCRKRNAILRLYQGRDVLILDDDYEYIGLWQNGVDVRCDPDRLGLMLDNGFSMARELGTPLWGINVQVDRRFYREYTPLSITNPVLGPFQAFTAERPDWLLYDEDLWLKEDYDLSLRVPAVYRLRERRWIQATDFWTESDGQGSARRRAGVDDEA